jgi:transposase
MSFRRIPFWCVGELLRRWQANQDQRKAARETGVDRKTVRRYWAWAQELALPHDRALTDADVHQVGERVQERPAPVSNEQAQLAPHRQRIAQWLASEPSRLNLRSIHVLLQREGITVSYSTLYRFAARELHGGKKHRMLPPQMRQKAQVLLEAGHSHKDVAERCKTSLRTVRRFAQEMAIAQSADVAEIRRRAIGRPSQTVEIADKIREWVAAKPHLETRELLRRAKVEGYAGKKSAFYALVASLRPESELSPPAKASPSNSARTAEPKPIAAPKEPDAVASVATPKRGSHRPSPTLFSFRVEYVRDSFADDATVLSHWLRDFTISGNHTLEHLSDIIIDILDWDPHHLYEFRNHDQVYAHLIFLEENDLLVDAKHLCVSCDIPIRLLSLSVGDVFTYIFDYGDHHHFRITVIDAKATASGIKLLPRLLSWKGNNLIQYPGTMPKKEERAFTKRTPTVRAPEPARDRWRIRFVRTEDQKILEEWRVSNNKKLWQKAVAILENRNMQPEEIAKKVERPTSHVEKWIKAFNRYGLHGLQKPEGRVHPSKPATRGKRQVAKDQKGRRLLELLHAKPSSYGINRSNWSLPALARAYQQQHGEVIATSTVGRLLRKFGYTIRKARRVLTSPDPDYREKVDLLLNTLQNLKPGDLFFFVDELGPLRVKKYGGRALVRKDESLTYPQIQAHRGVITMTGALSATANQVTWFYGHAKDTSAMIDLMELLFNQHFTASKLYVTWDAASWHRSVPLVEWLDRFNAETTRVGKGPTIHLVPLPRSSQFLDVLEAVFSGMKRAVVHHSDYAGVPEMKTAISRHFVERNEHFRMNPRRAGKKIWDIDFFEDHENIRSGNYREW